jgi:hypothetical protein
MSSSRSRVVPCGWAEGQTEMTKLKVVICNFANAPKKNCRYRILIKVTINLKAGRLALIPQTHSRFHIDFRTSFTGFYISLTVHFSIILVKNQLDTLYSMCLLFHLSTCFEHLVLIVRRVKLYQYSIWYISHYVGDCLVCCPDRRTRQSPT